MAINTFSVKVQVLKHICIRDLNIVCNFIRADIVNLTKKKPYMFIIKETKSSTKKMKINYSFCRLIVFQAFLDVERNGMV